MHLQLCELLRKEMCPKRSCVHRTVVLQWNLCEKVLVCVRVIVLERLHHSQVQRQYESASDVFPATVMSADRDPMPVFFEPIPKLTGVVLSTHQHLNQSKYTVPGAKCGRGSVANNEKTDTRFVHKSTVFVH